MDRGDLVNSRPEMWKYVRSGGVKPDNMSAGGRSDQAVVSPCHRQRYKWLSVSICIVMNDTPCHSAIWGSVTISGSVGAYLQVLGLYHAT